MESEKPTPFQKQIAAALGIDISHDTKGVAAARIHTFVGPAIHSKAAQYTATERQIDFARSLGLEVMGDSSLVASAKIADELNIRNKAALEKLQLQPGDRVRVRHQFEFDGETREWVQESVICSIQPNCRIMFKGGNGSGAWPTQVEKIVELPDMMTAPPILPQQG